MNVIVISALRGLLVLGFIGAVIVQFVLLFPALAQSIAQEEVVTIVPPVVSVIGVVLALCLEAGLVASWQLVTRAQHKTLFCPPAIRWVDVMIGSASVAALVAVASSVPLTRLAMSDDAPGLVALCAVILAATLGVVLVLLVARGVLRDASSLRVAR